MPPSSTSPKIFINYRREDSAVYAYWLYQNLTNHFGKKQIFIDKNSIAVGEDVEQKIESAVSECEILLAVIGRQWFLRSEKDSTGQRWKQRIRRIDDPRDVVRLEIAAAFDNAIMVVPILVQGARMPNIDELPNALKRLAPCNAFVFKESNWETDIPALIGTLEELLAKGPEIRRARKEEAEARRAREEQAKQQAAEAVRQAGEAEWRAGLQKTKMLKLRLKNIALSIVSFVVIYGIFTQLPQWMRDSATGFGKKVISYISSTPSPSPSRRIGNQDRMANPLFLLSPQPTPTPKPSATPDFISSFGLQFYRISPGGASSFLLGDRVTRAEWEQVMGKGHNSPPNKLSILDSFFFEVPKRDAEIFVKKLKQQKETNTYRLPTVAERRAFCPVQTGILPCDDFWVDSDPSTSAKGVRVVATPKPSYLTPELRRLVFPERAKITAR
jgi:hypothetical protein